LYTGIVNNTLTANQVIAEEIRRQIGRQALCMIGASQFVAIENGIQFAIKGSRAGNKIQITLRADLYTIKLWKIRGVNCKHVSTAMMIYAENLNRTIEDMTGLYTKL